jgi:Tol biopolymer transport system component
MRPSPIRRVWIAVAWASAALLAAATPAAAAVPTTARVSVSSSEEQAGGNSGWSGWGRSMAASGDGRFVAFTSAAADLVPNDTNGVWDVFRRDLLTGETIRVSVSSTEAQGNGASVFGVDISADGRFVVFGSRARNLVRADTNRSVDVFLRDVARGVTHRLSVDSSERQPNGRSRDPVISANGRMVAFSSRAPLVRGDTRIEDVYVRDRAVGKTRRVSVSTRGRAGNDDSFAPDLSANGRIVAFASSATNLVRRTDINFENPDIFVRDLSTGRTSRVSVDSDERQLGGCSTGGSSEPAVSGDGSRVAFTFIGSDSCGGLVMLRNRAAGTTVHVDIGLGGAAPNGWSFAGGISDDGVLVSFSSYASNLVEGDTNGVPFDFTGRDAFVRDVSEGTTTRVSVSESLVEANDSSLGGPISADGRFVVFASKASNLVTGDTNQRIDVFLRGALR